MKVPFLDLKSQYNSIKDEIQAAIASVIDNTAFISGSYAEKFENDYSVWNNSKHVVGCANGTDAIEIALQSLGVGPGDEVIVPAMTWISTAEAVLNVGAIPVFVDVRLDMNIDPSRIEMAISKKTRAVITVHLYGKPSALDIIKQICKKNKIFLVEDCAQAHGAQFEGLKVGNFGDIATFSFYPGKNLGAYGDAGAIVTNNSSLADECRLIANHGQLTKHNHLRSGRNSRLDGIQAAILSVKLKYLDNWLELRKQVANHYLKLLDPSLVISESDQQSIHSYHLFVINALERDKLRAHLSSAGINTNINYPKGLPFMNIFNQYVGDSSLFPNCALRQSNLLSLPIGEHLSPQQVEYVVQNINSFYS